MCTGYKLLCVNYHIRLWEKCAVEWNLDLAFQKLARSNRSNRNNIYAPWAVSEDSCEKYDKESKADDQE